MTLLGISNISNAEVNKNLDTEIDKNQLKLSKLNQKTRWESWEDYLKIGSYSLFLQNDPDMDYISMEKRYQIILERNKKWDQFFAYYRDADYISVTKMAPRFYNWKTHRAAAAYLSGVSFSKFNQQNKSLKELNRSIKYNFKNPQVYFEKAKILLSMDRLDESYANFKKSSSLNNQKTLSVYYQGWIKEIQGDYKTALLHYDNLLSNSEISADTVQSVQIRRAEIYDKISQNTSVDSRKRNAIFKNSVILPAKRAINLDPSSTNAKRLREFLQKLEQKYGLPSLVPFKIGSMGHYLRLNQYLSYNTNVTSLPEEISEYRDSWLMNTIFVYKHFFSSKKGFRHTPEIRINYTTHFEKNIPTIYAEDMFVVGPSLRNSFQHKLWGRPSSFSFDIETSYTAKDVNQDQSTEYFSRSLKLNIGESLKILKYGSTNFKLRQDFRNYFDSSLDSKTFTLFVNQLVGLKNNRTISLIANADFTSTNTSLNDTNSYMLRADYLHPKLIGNWELQTALTFLGRDTLEQSEIRGFETNISYEMEWRRKFYKEFEFAFNYNYAINSSKDKENFSYDKHVIALELQYIPKF